MNKCFYVINNTWFYSIYHKWMDNFIFSRLIRQKYPIEVTGRRTASNFIKWGTNYYSFTNVSEVNCGIYDCKTYANVTIYLPLTPIKIESYSLQTVSNDIFPTHWILYGSLDGSDWTKLSEINEPLCSVSYIYSNDNQKRYCNSSEIKTFPITINTNEYFHYFRYDLKNNSYVEDDGYLYAIMTKGFEISGSYLVPFFDITFPKTNSINMRFFVLFCLFPS